MNLKQSIKRIIKEETQLPFFVRRRVNLSDDTIKKILRYNILRFYKRYNGEGFIKKVMDSTTYDLLIDLEVLAPDYQKLFESLEEYITKKYLYYIDEFLKDTYTENEESEFCFVKHKNRHGGYGFTECFKSWFDLLDTYSRKFPQSNWKEIKEKLNTDQEVLVANPFEDHQYSFYFSVKRR